MSSGWKWNDKRVLIILLGVIAAVIIGYSSNASDLSVERGWVKANHASIGQVELPRLISLTDISRGVQTYFKLNQ
ncbi:hypothetical protein [Reichenbachiella ulvae]|uniref:Uncharacterized protein n=1 Tax=Reichenbachiella ulvae TaxID=2980104 RepID=A0ABT3D1N0_9BACT|nr:hypothetical protein [Reichenbachiella ulvae]MCV9389353.1 hypothetical protein [Reichenbachiella ulvae]